MSGNLFAEITFTITEVSVKVRKPIGTIHMPIPPHPHRHMLWERTEIPRVISIFRHLQVQQQPVTARTRLQILRTITRILTRNYRAPTHTSQSRRRVRLTNPPVRSSSFPDLRHVLSHSFRTLTRRIRTCCEEALFLPVFTNRNPANIRKDLLCLEQGLAQRLSGNVNKPAIRTWSNSLLSKILAFPFVKLDVNIINSYYIHKFIN